MRSTVSGMSEHRWQLRPLEPGDCDELGRVHMAIWRDAYAGVMPDDYLAGLSDERCADSWRVVANRPASAPGRTIVVVDEGGHLAGFGSAGPSRDDEPPTEWELYAVNLTPGARATGVADRLLDELLGDRDATLWVVEQNARARAFYARHGFVDEGGRDTHPAPGRPSSGWYAGRSRPPVPEPRQPPRAERALRMKPMSPNSRVISVLPHESRP